jgi:hypothetical protein
MYRTLCRNWRFAFQIPLLYAVAWAPHLACAQADPSPTTDAAALIRRAVANHMTAEAAHHPQRFVLHKKDGPRDYTQEIIETRQGDVAMAIAANGAPLTPDVRQLQIDRLNNLAAHPDLQEHRRRREQEDTDRVNKLMRLLPDAFLYQYDGTVACTVTTPPTVPVPGANAPSQPLPVASGTPATSTCYHLTFQPNPAWDPPDTESKIFRGMAGDVWIEKSQERLTRLSAHLVTDVEFGWGIIGHLNKGGTVFLEQTEMEDHDWELTRMKLSLTGKAFMVKTLNIQITEEMAHYAPVPGDLDYHKAIEMLESGPPSARQ